MPPDLEGSIRLLTTSACVSIAPVGYILSVLQAFQSASSRIGHATDRRWHDHNRIKVGRCLAMISLSIK